MKDICVICGDEVPEGRMVCKVCELNGVDGEDQPYLWEKASGDRKTTPGLFGFLRSGGYKSRFRRNSNQP